MTKNVLEILKQAKTHIETIATSDLKIEAPATTLPKKFAAPYNEMLVQSVYLMADRLAYHRINNCVTTMSIAWNSLSTLTACMTALQDGKKFPIPNLQHKDANDTTFRVSVIYLSVLQGLNVPDAQDYIAVLRAYPELLNDLTVAGPDALSKALVWYFHQIPETELERKEELRNFVHSIGILDLKAELEKELAALYEKKQAVEEKTIQVARAETIVQEIEGIKKKTFTDMPIRPMASLIRRARYAKLRQAGFICLSVNHEADIQPETYSRSQATVVKYQNAQNETCYRAYQHEWANHFLFTMDVEPTDFRGVGLTEEDSSYYKAGIIRVRNSDKLFYWNKSKQSLVELTNIAAVKAYFDSTYPLSAQLELAGIALTNQDLAKFSPDQLPHLLVEMVHFDLDTKSFSDPGFPVVESNSIEIKPLARTKDVHGEMTLDPHAKVDDPHGPFFKEISRARRQLGLKPKKTLSLMEQEAAVTAEITQLENQISGEKNELALLPNLIAQASQSNNEKKSRSTELMNESAILAREIAEYQKRDDEPKEKIRVEMGNLLNLTETGSNPHQGSEEITSTYASTFIHSAAYFTSKFLGGPEGSIPFAIDTLAKKFEDENKGSPSREAVQQVGSDEPQSQTNQMQLEKQRQLATNHEAQNEANLALNLAINALETHQLRENALTTTLSEKTSSLEALKKRQQQLREQQAEESELQQVKKALSAIDVCKLQKISSVARGHLEAIAARIQATREYDYIPPADKFDNTVLVKLQRDISAVRQELEENNDVIKRYLAKKGIFPFPRELAQLDAAYKKANQRANELIEICHLIGSEEKQLMEIEHNSSILSRVLHKPVANILYPSMDLIQSVSQSSTFLLWSRNVLPYLALLAGVAAVTITLGILLSNPHFALFIIPMIATAGLTQPLAITGAAVGGVAALAGVATIAYRFFNKPKPEAAQGDHVTGITTSPMTNLTSV